MADLGAFLGTGDAEDAAAEDAQEGPVYCYLLHNDHPRDSQKTYVGYTVNPARRIRQHNGELAAGARYTRRWGRGRWRMVALLTGMPEKTNAQQCEWRIKHPHGRRRQRAKDRTPAGSLQALATVLRLPHWTAGSAYLNGAMPLRVWVLREHAHRLLDPACGGPLPPNVCVSATDDVIASARAAEAA